MQCLCIWYISIQAGLCDHGCVDTWTIYSNCHGVLFSALGGTNWTSSLRISSHTVDVGLYKQCFLFGSFFMFLNSSKLQMWIWDKAINVQSHTCSDSLIFLSNETSFLHDLVCYTHVNYSGRSHTVTLGLLPLCFLFCLPHLFSLFSLSSSHDLKGLLWVSHKGQAVMV